MTNQEIIEKIYEIISEEEITTKKLNSCGFNSKEINTLIEQGIIERTRRGYYKFLAVNELYHYGKKLISSKEYAKANECFNKCYQLNPNHQGTCFQLFFRSINTKDYESAFKYFDVMLENDNPYYNTDYNLFLYLLSFITELPEKHKDYARYLHLEDIRVDFKDKRYKDIPTQNKIRKSILTNKFPYALQQLNDLTRKQNALTTQDIIIKTLLQQAIDVENKSEKRIFGYLKSKQYKEIINHLEEKLKLHQLSLTDASILTLTKTLLSITENNIIPEITAFQTENLFAAIDNSNYNLALYLCDEYNKKMNIIDSTSAIYILLSEICNLINQLAKKEKNITENKTKEEADSEKIFVEKEPVLKPTDNKKIIEQNNNNPSSTFSALINHLMESNIDNALIELKKYLKLINKQEYEFLIINLIKLSIIEQDVAFTKPMITLTYLSRGEFNFDISLYIQEFYVAFSQNKFDIARIYLDIISNAKNIGHNVVLAESLSQALTKAEEKINKKSIIQEEKNISEPQSIESVKEPFEEEISVVVTSEKTPSSKQEIPVVEMEKEVLVSKKEVSKEELLYVSRDSEREFIERHCKTLLKNHGIVLLKPMNSERRKRVHEIIKEYPEIVSFSIGEEPNRQIVLRFKLNEYVNIKEVIKEAKVAFENGKYEECIELNKQLLSVGNPSSKIYAMIGFCLIRTSHKNLAINYLTVANELSKIKGLKFDYSKTISVLKGDISEEDKKENVKVALDEFENPQENYYGIDNFEDINAYITVSGLDVDGACKILKLNEEQRTRVKLVYARLYYTQGQYEKGDEFLKAAEQNKNKSNFTKKAIEELRKNKKFYINRAKEKQPQLVRTLKPQK